MSTFATSTGTTTTAPVLRSAHTSVVRIGLWVLRIGLAIQFAGGGILKLIGDPAMVTMFDDIGVGQWLRLLVGTCELAGAIGLLVPRLSRLAASGIVGLTVGAASTNVIALHISPVLPLVMLALAALVAVTGSRTGGSR